MIVSIDYLREHAATTGLYGGQTAPLWYDLESNKWVDVWTSKATKPHAAKISVYRKDVAEPFTHIAYLEAHNTGKNQWAKNYANMLGKCAEAGALRKAFPDCLSGLYIDEEMQHNVKKGSKYDEPMREETKERLLKLKEHTNPALLESNDITKHLVNNIESIKDEYTAKKLRYTLENLNHNETCHFNEVFNDLVNGDGKKYGKYLSDEEYDRFLVAHENGVYENRDKCFSLVAIIDNRIKQEEAMEQAKTEIEKEQELLSLYNNK